MSKLTLKLGGIKEMLTKDQMKKIVGGYACEDDGCKEDTDCPKPNQNKLWTKCYTGTCLSTGKSYGFCGEDV